MHFNMNRNRILKLAGFLLLALALFSCTDTNLAPVFYALEQEKSLIDDRGFPDDAVVQRLVQNGLGGRYFAAAGNLYWREANSASNWSRIAPPVSGALCTNVEIFGAAPTCLVAAYMLPDNTGLGLYYRNADLVSDNWNPVSGLPSNAQVGLLRNINDTNLFVSILSGGTYSLYYSSTFPTFTPTNLTATMTTGPISDISLAGTTYWVSVGSALYSTTDLIIFSADSTVSTARAFAGLFISSGGTLYLAADGKFYTGNGTPGSWTAHPVPAVDSKSVQFTTFVETSGLPGSHVYAGTGGYGYYDTDTLARSPSYTISDLYDGAILSMLYDGSTSPPSLLLGTYNSGLWRGDWTGSTWAWKQE